jgi:RNA polymerase sigma factor (sigma-70 family)
MPTTQLSAAVARVGHAVLPPDPAATDGALLARFVRTRDEPAFRELVRRHGPMVLGVCRRVAGNAHLAEDAFQAAFLVLARRAADVPRGAVRGWLYGVAARTARKARAMSARRLAREVPVAALPERAAEPAAAPDAEALRVLDEEVGALPEHLRAAVVLCELDGASRRDAAARFGIPEGTVASRLAKARKLLAARLRKRGVALPAAGLAWALGRPAAAAVPSRLLSATAALADGSAPVPASVAQLSQGVLKAMFLTKLQVFALCGLLAVAGLAAGLPGSPGARAGSPPVPAAGNPAPDARADEKKPQPAAKPAGPGRLLLARQGGLVALTPEGKEGAELPPPKGTHTTFAGRFSPDGKRAAFLVAEDGPPLSEPPAKWPFKVVVHTFGEESPAVVDVPARDVTLCWTADGSRVVLTTWTGNRLEKGVETLVLDPATGKTEPLALPDGARVLDCARDGKTFLVVRWDGKKGRIGLAATGDKEVRELAELKGWVANNLGRLSPDGKAVLYTDADPTQKDANKWGMSSRPYLLDVATRKAEMLPDFPENGQCLGVAWAPDGKRVAYTWKQVHPEVVKKDMLTGEDALVETEAFLIVAGADGKNATTVASAKLENAINPIFGSVDWR